MFTLKPVVLTLALMALSWLPSLAGEPTDSFLRSPFVAAFDPTRRLYQPLPPPYPPAAVVTDSFLRSPFVAAFDPAPRLSQPPGAPVLPAIPPGRCRWERYLLDGHGRPVLDPYGGPVKEYRIGSCHSPPE